MTKIDLTLAVVKLAELANENTENRTVLQMVKASKEVCENRYNKVMAEANRVQAAKYVVMCCTGIIPNGIDKNWAMGK